MFWLLDPRIPPFNVSKLNMKYDKSKKTKVTAKASSVYTIHYILTQWQCSGTCNQGCWNLSSGGEKHCLIRWTIGRTQNAQNWSDHIASTAHLMLQTSCNVKMVTILPPWYNRAPLTCNHSSNHIVLGSSNRLLLWKEDLEHLWRMCTVGSLQSYNISC